MPPVAYRCDLCFAPIELSRVDTSSYLAAAIGRCADSVGCTERVLAIGTWLFGYEVVAMRHAAV
jgi:hypothetical protein